MLKHGSHFGLGGLHCLAYIIERDFRACWVVIPTRLGGSDAGMNAPHLLFNRIMQVAGETLAFFLGGGFADLFQYLFLLLSMALSEVSDGLIVLLPSRNRIA